MTRVSLTEKDKDRIKKFLALMASENDGEALNATRMVVRTLAAHGMRPEELMEMKPAWMVNAQREAEQIPHPSDFAKTLVLRAQTRGVRLTQNEQNFLLSLAAQVNRRMATPAQSAWLRKIETKIADSGA